MRRQSEPLQDGIQVFLVGVCVIMEVSLRKGHEKDIDPEHKQIHGLAVFTFRTMRNMTQKNSFYVMI